jgi:hypothetical protein
VNPYDFIDQDDPVALAYQLRQDMRDLEDVAHRSDEAHRVPLRAQYRSLLGELRRIQPQLDALPACRTCAAAAGDCYLQCPRHPGYYGPRTERADALDQDAMSHDAWHAAAVRQYEAAHGQPWCS